MSFSIELWPQSDKDLEDSFDYTIERFGIEQAVKYVPEFDQVFEALRQHSQMGGKRYETSMIK